jgi:uncharacterized membrane protein
MSWQIIIVAQVIASAIMTVFTRKLSLTDRKLFFVIGGLSYGMVAIMGVVFSFVFGAASVNPAPAHAWPYLITEGAFIPISWLLQYKIIQRLGASNAVLVTMLNYVGTAALGLIFIGEKVSVYFWVGLILILSSIVIAFKVQPDTIHRQNTTTTLKIILVISMVATYSFGMFAEKQAIDIMGVWSYARIGWSLQFVGSLILVGLYGRSELSHLNFAKTQKGLFLGFLTSISGGLYIYTL